MSRSNPILAFAATILVAAGQPYLSMAAGAQQLSVVTVNGESHVTIGDTLRGAQMLEYRLAIAPGQHVSMSIESDNAAARFNLMAPDRPDPFFDGAVDGSRFEGDLATAGTYTIRAYLLPDEAQLGEHASFTIRGELRPIAP